LQIVPIESLEGRRLVEAGNMCMRKTADTNVDLNRNWPFAWQKAVRLLSGSLTGLLQALLPPNPSPISSPR
jgi:hypothetical protein